MGLWSDLRRDYRYKWHFSKVSSSNLVFCSVWFYSFRADCGVRLNDGNNQHTEDSVLEPDPGSQQCCWHGSGTTN